MPLLELGPDEPCPPCPLLLLVPHNSPLACLHQQATASSFFSFWFRNHFLFLYKQHTSSLFGRSGTMLLLLNTTFMLLWKWEKAFCRSSEIWINLMNGLSFFQCAEHVSTSARKRTLSMRTNLPLVDMPSLSIQLLCIYLLWFNSALGFGGTIFSSYNFFLKVHYMFYYHLTKNKLHTRETAKISQHWNWKLEMFITK